MGEQDLDHNEEIELVLLSLEEVKDLLQNQEVLQSMHVTALFYALNKLGVLNF
jgi:hypothetical protein